tara:strand:+ start:2319 stop:2447 length:129 start_codon:yes stop_codon:yes gene_type:complete
VIGVSIADPQVIEISRLFAGLNGYHVEATMLLLATTMFTTAK